MEMKRTWQVCVPLQPKILVKGQRSVGQAIMVGLDQIMKALGHVVTYR